MSYQIIPKGCKVKSVFKSHEEFEKYSTDFYEKIRPELEKQKEARRKSLEDSRNDIKNG